MTSTTPRPAAAASSACEQALDALTRAGSLNAVLSVLPDRARASATAIDALDAADRATRPLAGVPIAVKDNICVRGTRTTAGSKILESFVAPYDATVVERLEAAGAVIVAKANCDEFAMGSSNENSAFGPVANPWDATRTPGGSSGGSAALVAAGVVPIALGSDTGGSIRQPASFCGIVGIKPTYGRVSRYGLIAYGSSLDQIGPFARSVREAARVLRVIAGPDPRDATTVAAAPFEVPEHASMAGLRVGVPRALLNDGVEPGVRAAIERALATFAAGGATITDIELPHAAHAIPTYYLVATAEASSNLSRFDGVRFGYRAPTDRQSDLTSMYASTRSGGFGPEVMRRILLGTYVLSAGYYDAYYRKAQQVRTLITRDYEQALAGVDVIAMPTAPTTAFKLGEKVEDPLQMYLADVFTVSANLTGLPAISVPCGLDEHGLPVGLQLTGPAFGETVLLRAAAAYEDARGALALP
ncbi:MAG TPA: Asp-tRNA(Asn)/Glu-tRNA(Gln) amidotransferase subunit GatA, partial [Luteitalea sp.]|nr:Asp-tRNA(Asn)/Glu-tRNA(Gln) amidotransferase subunit GatA [Luteitalea sp.]